jgi:DNA-binding NtrC family response regulator
MARSNLSQMGTPGDHGATAKQSSQDSATTSGSAALSPLGTHPHLAPLRVLVVDDERPIRVSCEAIARSSGFDAASVSSGEEALERLAREPFDIVLLDIRMPKASGLDLIEELLAISPGSYIVMMTGHASIEAAVEAMKKGAYHFIQKPFHLDEIRIVLQRIGEEITASAEATMWRSQVDTSKAFGRMLGSTGPMRQIFRMAARASVRKNPILIVGEPGTGKELIARCIHDCGERNDRPFLAIDCDAAPPDKQFEALSGVESGGEAAASIVGGSVLLNEVSLLSKEAQSHLFRLLDNRSNPPDFRVMATTSRDLDPLVARGEFRSDLLYRLSVFVLRMPPLRERVADIPLLVDYFLDLDAADKGRRIEATSETLQVLMRYPWPGNVRQLRSVVERSVASMTGTVLKVSHLPPDLKNWKKETVSQSSPAVVETMAEVEKRAVMEAMKFTNGDKVKAAQLLGISRTTLYRKLEEYK